MNLKKTPYKGTRDLFPPDKRVLDYLLSIMKKTALSFGYEPYDGPLLEEVSLYRAKSGQELVNEQVYSFLDRGERSVAIRPEMTPTLARMIARVHRELPLPIRWFSLPNLYRYERPQRGRYREHWQLNVDIFGAPANMGEIETLQLLIQLMKNFQADKSMFEILINDRRITHTFLKNVVALDQEKTLKVYKIIDKYKKIPSEKFQEMLKEVGLSNKQNEHIEEYLNVESFEKLFTFFKNQENTQHFFDFYEMSKNFEIADYLRYDPSIVRGLDYYTGIVFEVYDKHPDNRRAICGGGAYENLLEIFEEPTLPGIGFGLGDVTLRDFLITHNLLPDFSKNHVDIYLCSQIPQAIPDIIKLGNRLRSHGLKVLTNLSPIKFNKACHTSEKNGARFMGVIDEKEISQGVIQIRNATTRKATMIPLKEIDEICLLISQKQHLL